MQELITCTGPQTACARLNTLPRRCTKCRSDCALRSPLRQPGTLPTIRSPSEECPMTEAQRPADVVQATISEIGGHSPAERCPREDRRPAFAGDRRPGRGDRRTADLPLRPRPLPAGRRAGPGQDADDQHAGPDAEPVVQPHPVHARPDAGRHHRHGNPGREPHDRPARAAVPRRAAVRATSFWPTKSTARRRRRRPRCWKRCRSGK